MEQGLNRNDMMVYISTLGRKHKVKRNIQDSHSNMQFCCGRFQEKRLFNLNFS